MKNKNEQYGIWARGRRTMWLSEEEIKKLQNNDLFLKIVSDKS